MTDNHSDRMNGGNLYIFSFENPVWKYEDELNQLWPFKCEFKFPIMQESLKEKVIKVKVKLIENVFQTHPNIFCILIKNLVKIKTNWFR